jgi:hypothetical protein
VDAQVGVSPDQVLPPMPAAPPPEGDATRPNRASGGAFVAPQVGLQTMLTKSFGLQVAVRYEYISLSKGLVFGQRVVGSLSELGVGLGLSYSM